MLEYRVPYRTAAGSESLYTRPAGFISTATSEPLPRVSHPIIVLERLGTPHALSITSWGPAIHDPWGLLAWGDFLSTTSEAAFVRYDGARKHIASDTMDRLSIFPRVL